jgi:glycosyltransferase involved in cell wall biosynthesis
VIPQLSVIIVAYRSRDEIGPCLNSLPRELDGREVEVIVVDNFAGQWRE